MGLVIFVFILSFIKFHFNCISFDLQSWDDEDGIDSGSYSNAVTGTIPDGSYGSNTQIQYCTYGPSFCIILSTD